VWLEPYPEAAGEGIVEQRGRVPEDRYERREAGNDSRPTALNRLPTSQRAVLVLRSSGGSDDTDTSHGDAAVNNTDVGEQRAHQRPARRSRRRAARASIEHRSPDQPRTRARSARFADAFERGNVENDRRALGAAAGGR